MNFNWEKFNTDKNMSGHGYNTVYDYFLSSNRHNIKKVVEIGTRTGSIQLWLEYFPNSKLFGIDIENPNFQSDRFIFENIDQGNDEHWKNFIKKHGEDFDLIIDDGPHTTPEQLISFNILFNCLKSGGIYVIEDLHCTEPYDKSYLVNRKNCNYSILDILKQFKNSNYTENSFLYNIDKIKNQIKDIIILKSENNRWPNNMSEPSDIVFIFKK